MVDSLPILVFGKALAKTQGLSRLRLTQVLFKRAHFLGPDLPAPEREIGPGEAMIIWTAELLNRTQFTVDQQNAILDDLGEQLYSLGARCRGGLQHGTRPGLFLLVFTDGRYFTYSGCADFLDLETGLRASPDRQPVESLSYNLVELFARRYLEATVD
jgi:hypothetical protein